MAHDFKNFPELTNSQMQVYYFESPHKQIIEDFRAKVIKVTDGDTVRVRTTFRDFDFPIRFLDTNAPEMSEGGQESKNWLKQKIENEEVDILINANNRVGKYGRLLGIIIAGGMNINEESIRMGMATPFDQRNEGAIPNLNKELVIEKWL